MINLRSIHFVAVVACHGFVDLKRSSNATREGLQMKTGFFSVRTSMTNFKYEASNLFATSSIKRKWEKMAITLLVYPQYLKKTAV